MAADNDSGLELIWSFGFSSWIRNSVHDLHPIRPNCLVAATGIHAVIYNFVSGQQQALVGHTSAIGALITSHDRSIIITGEAHSREDGLVIVWESRSGLPLASRNLAQGVQSICVNASNTTAALLTTPNANGVQSVVVWSWASNTLTEIKLGAVKLPRSHICWSPTSNDVCVTNPDSVVFVDVDDNVREGRMAATIHQCLVPSSGHCGSRAYGRLVQSVYVPNRSEVLSGSDTGTIVVWAQHFSEPRRTFMKAVPLYSSSPITFLDVIDELVAIGTQDQALRFLDLQFRIVFWFEDFAYGPINSLSFLRGVPGASLVQAGQSIRIPEFIFATTEANVVKITAKSIQTMPNSGSPRGYLLVKGFGDTITSLVAHTTEPLFAVATRSGSFQLIDYLDRTIQIAKQFAGGARIASMAFSNTAETRSMALALVSDSSASQLQICSLPNRLSVSDQFDIGRGTLHLLSFSSCDSYMALASTETVAGDTGPVQRPLLYLYERSRSDSHWAFVGRVQPHSQAIVQIAFDRFQLQLYRCRRLLSLSLDQTLAVVDLPNSTASTGIRVSHTTPLRLDPIARPISMCIQQLQQTNVVVVHVSDTIGKVRSFIERPSDDRSWICIRTGAAPINDDCIAQRLIPLSSSNEVMAYCSAARFLGLMTFPANFNQSTAVIGHSGAIDQVAAGFDGKMVLSCDAQQQCVHLWRLDLTRFQSTLSSNPITYLADDLDRVRHVISYMMVAKGAEHHDHDPVQGETLPRDRVVELFHALGCYMSQQHSRDLDNELLWSADGGIVSILDSSSDERKPNGSISLLEIMALWLNHRPVKPDPDLEAVAEAFRILGANRHGEIVFDHLLSALEQHGERLTRHEYEQCRQMIRTPIMTPTALITPSIFLDQILQFGNIPYHSS